MTNFQSTAGLPAVAPLKAQPARQPTDEKLFQVAQKLEASFLAEMLKSAGFGKTRDSFGGGAGEEHFSTFLTQAHASAMAKTGGIGLAESIFDALKEKQNDQA